MGKTTAIAWADSTVNPVIGCPGCELGGDCYARRFVARHEGRKGWPHRFHDPILKPEVMAEAYRWPDLAGTDRPDKPWLSGLPRLVFVSDLGDVFGAIAGPYPQEFRRSVRDWLRDELRRMAGSPHRFLILTKWPAVARGVLRGQQCPPNVWLGVSVCDASTKPRIAALLRNVDIQHRFVSFEPLRGAVGNLDLRGIDWVIVGGQSGPGWLSPTHPEPWPALAGEIRQSCVTYGVPFFFKQQPGAHPGSEPYLCGRQYREVPCGGRRTAPT
jgi:protein gp37